jgi:hypothetical protein
MVKMAQIRVRPRVAHLPPERWFALRLSSASPAMPGGHDPKVPVWANPRGRRVVEGILRGDRGQQEGAAEQACRSHSPA